MLRPRRGPVPRLPAHRPRRSTTARSGDGRRSRCARCSGAGSSSPACSRASSPRPTVGTSTRGGRRPAGSTAAAADGARAAVHDLGRRRLPRHRHHPDRHLRGRRVRRRRPATRPTCCPRSGSRSSSPWCSSVLADRIGRRRLVSVAAAGRHALVTATGALAPSMFGLGATQTVARGFAGALLLLIVIISAEEMPGGSRAWGVLGAGDVPGAGRRHVPVGAAARRHRRRRLGVVAGAVRRCRCSTSRWWPLVHRHLPESRRFELVNRTSRPPASPATAGASGCSP